MNPIGLVGSGLLGSALAERFVESGLAVLSYDIDPARRSAESLEQVAADCRRIVLSLPDSNVVAGVLDQIEPHLKDGAILVDTTTGAPDQIAGFGARLAARNVQYLDATVGGSSRQVRAKDVIVMCGGEARTYADCADLFACFARETFHVGPWGSGARMKLVLNLVLGLNRAVLAEGLAFAEASGLAMETVLRILKAGPAWSRVMDTKGEKMLRGDFTPEARLSQHLKDVRLILEAAQRNRARVPLSELHRRLLEEAESAGLGGADNSAIIEAFRQ